MHKTLNTFLTLGIAVTAILTTSVSHADSQCTQADLTRSINVVYAEQGQPVPCEVLYEKPAESQIMTLWRAYNEAGYCEARAAEFVAKLETLGWTCTTIAEENEAASQPGTR